MAQRHGAAVLEGLLPSLLPLRLAARGGILRSADLRHAGLRRADSRCPARQGGWSADNDVQKRVSCLSRVAQVLFRDLNLTAGIRSSPRGRRLRGEFSHSLLGHLATDRGPASGGRA